MNEAEFEKFVKSECKKHGIKILLSNSKKIYWDDEKKNECSGYFDEANLTLACAKKNSHYFTVLIHEYCHMTQYLDNCKEWSDSNKHNSHGVMEEWLLGVDHDNIEFYLGLCRDVELDNEKRAVKLIKKLELPVDINLYIQKSNAYVQFYNYLLYSRKWCTTDTSPYSLSSIYSKMPTKFNMRYDRISKKVKRIFDEAYGTKESK